MKKIISFTIIVALVIVAGMVYMLNKSSSSAATFDSLCVEAHAPLTVNNIKIEYGFNSLQRKSDVDLFKERERYTIIFDGEMKDTLVTKYGENDFLVTYDSTYYLSFRQVKSWKKKAHSYNFLIYQEDSIPSLKVDIMGIDSMSFNMRMIPISEASRYVINTPIDSAGAVYKFMKLANPDISEEQKAKMKKDEDELLKKMDKLFIQ